MTVWKIARDETIFIPQACETSGSYHRGLWYGTMIKQLELISHTVSLKCLLSSVQMKGQEPGCAFAQGLCACQAKK